MRSPKARLHQTEFVALMAMLSGTIAFSIDAMLPALPEIAQDLTPDAPNRAQLIITSFVLGLGVGTLFTGMLSDRFGRKPVMIGGAVVYCLGALLAWRAPTLEMMLLARVIQGLGAAGPRVVAMAMTRDLYEGWRMARIMSFIMIVFTLVPAIAPSLGAVIVWAAGWRQVFLAFLAFAVVSGAWLMLRQPETLAREDRSAIGVRAMASAAGEIIRNPTTRVSVIVQTLCFGMLFSTLSSVQQMFDITYGKGDSFPLYFGGMAVVASTASMLNARLVGRLGMRRLVKSMLSVQLGLTTLMIVLTLTHLPTQLEFLVFLFWTTSVFFQAGLTMGNLNALAMEPLGHIAGKAASLISAFSTVGAVLIAVPVGLAYDGTPLPIAISLLVLAVIAVVLTNRIKRPGEG